MVESVAFLLTWFILPHKLRVRLRKRLVYFRKGAHSHIKINAPEKYDGVIIDFLRELCHNNTITDGIIGDET